MVEAETMRQKTICPHPTSCKYMPALSSLTPSLAVAQGQKYAQTHACAPKRKKQHAPQEGEELVLRNPTYPTRHRTWSEIELNDVLFALNSSLEKSGDDLARRLNSPPRHRPRLTRPPHPPAPNHATPAPGESRGPHQSLPKRFTLRIGPGPVRAKGGARRSWRCREKKSGSEGW